MERRLVSEGKRHTCSLHRDIYIFFFSLLSKYGRCVRSRLFSSMLAMQISRDFARRAFAGVYARVVLNMKDPVRLAENTWGKLILQFRQIYRVRNEPTSSNSRSNVIRAAELIIRTTESRRRVRDPNNKIFVLFPLRPKFCTKFRVQGNSTSVAQRPQKF